MFDEIFEIANQAYILQQQLDKEEIDDRNWREWTKLFSTQESIKAAYIDGKPDFDEDDDKVLGETIINNEQESIQRAECVLDDEELTDYLKNQAQWSTELITDEQNQFKVEDIVNAGEPTGGKGGKGAPADTTLPEKEMTIPEELPKNNLLGDVVEQIIHLNYEGEKEIVKPDVAHHVPLRLAIIGKAFSGKKTQAQLIAEKYNLKQYHPYDLITEAISRSEETLEEVKEEPSQEESPEETHVVNNEEGKPEGEVPEAENEGENQEVENPEANKEQDAEEIQEQTVEVQNAEENKEESKAEQEEPKAEQEQKEGETQEIVVGEDQENIRVTKEGENQEVLKIETEENQESEEPSNVQPPVNKFEVLKRNAFREIGIQMKQELLKGKEIPEELVVDLLTASIKADFAFKTQEEIDQDIKKVIQREVEINQKLSEAEQLEEGCDERKEIDEEGLKKELQELSTFNKYGWILVDFPCSMQQASKLEAQLSGYLPEIDKEICVRNEKLKSA